MINTGYPGIYQDDNGGLSPWGQVILDAWIFGLLPEGEQCIGWEMGRLQGLYEKVYHAWEPYGHLPSRLPPELGERHARLYAAIVERARAAGWEPDVSNDG